MKTVECNSSAISRVQYDEKSKTLVVWFVQGGTDTVQNVSLEMFNAFCAARSQGQFYNQHFKRR